jgi:hypothetical protein
MVANLFGLARDGKTDAKGMPNILQLAVFAREFEDVVYFTNPPRSVQKILFGVLAPIARLLGYRGSYAKYIERGTGGSRSSRGRATFAARWRLRRDKPAGAFRASVYDHRKGRRGLSSPTPHASPPVCAADGFGPSGGGCGSGGEG